MSYDYATHNENGGGEKTITTASGVITTQFSDLLGRSSKTLSGETGTTTYAYHPLVAATGSRGKLQSVTDGDDVSITYGYDSEGEQTTTSRTIPLASGTATQVTTTARDVVANVVLQGQNLGIAHRQTQTLAATGVPAVTTSRSYAAIAGLATGSEAFGRETLSLTTRPDASGIATTTVTQPDGTKVVQTRTHGLVTAVQNRSTTGTILTATTYGHDTLQRPITATVARTGTTTYDLRNNATGVLTPDGLADVTESGQPLAMRSPANHTTAQTYDIMGRQTSTTLPDNTVTYTAYYPTGQVKVTWGSQTYPTWNVYDEQGRQTQLHTWKIAPPLTLASIPENPPGGSEVTTWIFNSASGHLVEKNYPGEIDDGTTDADYAYTPAGRLLIRTSERGITTTYGYTHGLMSSTDYSDTTPDVAITYEPLGRQSTVTTAVAKSEFTYDPATLAVDTEAISYNLDAIAGYDFFRVLDRKPTSLGRDTGWQLKDGATIENEAAYAYGPADGRISSISNPQLSNVSFTYGYLTNSSLLNTVTKAASGGNPALVVTRTYEPTRDTLAAIENNAGTIVRSKYDYAVVNGGVNSLGQRMGVQTTFNLGAGHVANAGDTSWDYDGLGQLTSANHGTEDTIDRAYLYDAIGNRKKSADSLTLPGTDNYTTNALNQYTAVNTFIPTHDPDGNQRDAQILPLGSSSLASCVYHWDAENRLVQVRAADDTTVITTTLYDAQFRRIATAAGGTTTLYLYDGFNCIAEYAGSTLSKTRLWGLDLSGTMQGAGGVGGLLCESQISNSQITNYYPTYDGNGNISEYLAADGSVSAHFEYDPFGNTVVNTDTTNKFAYRFSTKPRDLTTGLYYYGYRWYDPATGRWPSRDPIEEDGGINLYEFIDSSPLNFVDAFGLHAILARGTSPLNVGPYDVSLFGNNISLKVAGNAWWKKVCCIKGPTSTAENVGKTRYLITVPNLTIEGSVKGELKTAKAAIKNAARKKLGKLGHLVDLIDGDLTGEIAVKNAKFNVHYDGCRGKVLSASGKGDVSVGIDFSLLSTIGLSNTDNFSKVAVGGNIAGSGTISVTKAGHQAKFSASNLNAKISGKISEHLRIDGKDILNHSIELPEFNLYEKPEAVELFSIDFSGMSF